MMPYELNKQTIGRYISNSHILLSHLSLQLGISSTELINLVITDSNWSFSSRTGKYTLSVNGKKLIASPSTNEKTIDLIVK